MAQASLASSVSARGASSAWTASVSAGASTAIASASLPSPLINSSASLGLGKWMRLVICALGCQNLPVGGFDGDLLFYKFSAFLEDKMASRRSYSAAGQRFDKNPFGI
jgi:hypothetical protein